MAETKINCAETMDSFVAYSSLLQVYEFGRLEYPNSELTSGTLNLSHTFCAEAHPAPLPTRNWQKPIYIYKTPWSESASELYRPSDRHLSAKGLPTFADRGCHVVSVTDPYGRILGFLDRSRYFSIK
jgi:hypothetical protein